eukprot:4009224-Prorocentrum_lima.AAC.1
MDAAFSTITWMVRSGHASCSRCATGGTAQKWRESRPQRPRAPRWGPATVSCWQAEPATISSNAPG